MNYVEEITQYKPVNEQEQVDQAVILDYIKSFPHNVLLRDNAIAHMTSSAIIVNQDHSKMLMIYHKIYDTWTWVGGHADGEADMLKLALKEAQEETGLKSFKTLGDIHTIDILNVNGHMKKNKYVGQHLHLNVAYVFEADDKEDLLLNEEETSGLKWVSIEKVPEFSGEKEIIYVYEKMFKSAGIQYK